MKHPNNLRQLRFLKGFHTARSFAKALGVTPVIVSSWERGESVPSISSINKILGVLECDYRDLWVNMFKDQA